LFFTHDQMSHVFSLQIIKLISREQVNTLKVTFLSSFHGDIFIELRQKCCKKLVFLMAFVIINMSFLKKVRRDVPVV
ncbi:MAG TPA: hypothetical protein PK583_05285, partial [Gammaproteobacteria bacterium]|nr:hypothetical protein [Gammaproteobacteria bacterium]